MKKPTNQSLLNIARKKTTHLILILLKLLADPTLHLIMTSFYIHKNHVNIVNWDFADPPTLKLSENLQEI